MCSQLWESLLYPCLPRSSLLLSCYVSASSWELCITVAWEDFRNPDAHAVSQIDQIGISRDEAQVSANLKTDDSIVQPMPRRRYQGRSAWSSRVDAELAKSTETQAQHGNQEDLFIKHLLSVEPSVWCWEEVVISFLILKRMLPAFLDHRYHASRLLSFYFEFVLWRIFIRCFSCIYQIGHMVLFF